MPDGTHDATPFEVPSSIRVGDIEAFDRLFLTYARPLRGFIYSYVRSWQTAEELVDDVFLQLWVRLQDVRTIREPKSYLFTTARNRAIGHLRHQKVELRYRQRFAAPEPAEPGLVLPNKLKRHLADRDQGLTDDDLTAALQRAVDELPPRQRAVVLLKWQGKASNDEIAEALGIVPTTVSEHFRRALHQLRVLLPPILAELGQ